MIIKRTNSEDLDFQQLVKQLDVDLKIRDGDAHDFYAQFNTIDTIKYAVVAYDQNEAVGCGAIRQFSDDTMEVKRMFVVRAQRGKGIESIILKELENWTTELHFHTCILETGHNQPEAIELYRKNNYAIIPNYGNYAEVENSVCFRKEL
ncbi:GNAT family N-acetyltransferase [Flavobacterium sp. GT3R68]|uniref:GNAT family N-acetyltransferase n=1 Tax=Flavobacterium sp. GT3R68 TaxID=2594437 RepID=UPI000F872409|nr:GNAT family N-acetyltransferase [Flavobacterium sp. GT3R68]RTY95306.1 GNAT family N-acetyltransferase [Flavobacterium sp. GSN2]TRW90953.1 GNAT family N-acetyltransferase [Flavobacterium sp. GT3R68]